MKLLLTQSFTPSFDGGLGGVVPPPVVGITAWTITPIIIPMAVRILTIVMPCSLNNVFSRSRRVVSSFRTLFIVSFILFIWPRNTSLFALAASSLAALSSSKFCVRDLISLLLVSSSASCNFCFCLVMSLSSSVSFD